MNIRKMIETGLAESGMTNAELADKMDIHQASISNMKKQKAIRPPTMKAMADAFGLSVSEFIKLGE